MFKWKEWMDKRIKWQCLNGWVERVNRWKDKVTINKWSSGKCEWMMGYRVTMNERIEWQRMND